MAWVIVVPGSADKRFLDGLRARRLMRNIHRVAPAGTDDRVVAEAVRLRREWQLRGHATLFLRDVERTSTGLPPCSRQVLSRFDASIDRSRVVLARVSMESWYLSDELAINRLLPRAGWAAPPNTDVIVDPQAQLTTLIRRNSGRRTDKYLKPDFAERLARYFDPTQGAQRSPSLRRLLAILNQ
jgi:hypothetical protein